jgi:hypothetical protein
MCEIIDTFNEGLINPKVQEIIYIRPVDMLFNDGADFQKGALIKDKTNRSYIYPIISDPTMATIQFINNVLRSGDPGVFSILKDGYLNKKFIVVDDKVIDWDEYEFLFHEYDFYSLPPKNIVLVIEDWSPQEDQKLYTAKNPE